MVRLEFGDGGEVFAVGTASTVFDLGESDLIMELADKEVAERENAEEA